MAVSITLDFDTAWADRLAPMVIAKIDEMQNHPLIVALIAATPGIDSVDDLTTKQKAKLWILFHLLRDLMKWEGQSASEAARVVVVEDLQDNFPLEFGDAT